MKGSAKEFRFSELRFVIENGKIRMTGAFGSEPHKVNEVYTFAEVQIAGEDHPAHHGAKYFYTSECDRLMYVSHRIDKADTGEETLTIVQKSQLAEVQSTFVSYPNSTVIRAWNTVRNIAERDIVLEYVSSFSVTVWAKVPWKERSSCFYMSLPTAGTANARFLA